MKALIQRVSSASVSVDGNTVGSIEKGFLVLLGVGKGDTREDLQYLARKVANLRVFEDSDGKMNLGLKDIGGSALVISQFTLCADTRKGNRPSFQDAMEPDGAKSVYEDFRKALSAEGIHVESGVFGAMMKVSLLNDGPVTILLETGIDTL